MLAYEVHCLIEREIKVMESNEKILTIKYCIYYFLLLCGHVHFLEFSLFPIQLSSFNYGWREIFRFFLVWTKGKKNVGWISWEKMTKCDPFGVEILNLFRIACYEKWSLDTAAHEEAIGLHCENLSSCVWIDKSFKKLKSLPSVVAYLHSYLI